MITTITNQTLTVAVNSCGAELYSIRTGDGCEYLWQGDPAYWMRRSPNLFPVVGLLPENRYRVGGKEFSLQLHGFAKETEFQLVAREPDRLRYRLAYTPETLANYPFKFELAIEYLIQGQTLTHRFLVKNVDQRDLFFSVGAHPGFRCPLEAGERQEDYSLEFETDELAERRFIEQNLLTGKRERFLDHEKTVPLSAALFSRQAIILQDLKSRSVTLRSNRSGRKVTVAFAGFPYLGIWSAPGPFVCIEPWYGITSPQGAEVELERKEGILALESGKQFECEYRITVG